ncbi:Pyrroline-5-carboxylate [Cyphellophora attinorum]|uniref:Pyrroline-5-carboxylate reductase n=1 Tax=Cyphellophora attinorum TaxID=1664694 RepID=A0A0N1NY97_9EURO|nr:Pyrroline-5-carboxylate [Phialophora attinorum]KPI39423.1 Pyrroline-5-carboxylate [Phialophora attinorum]
MDTTSAPLRFNTSGNLAVMGKSPPMTLTVLGCGTLGIAILSGILSSISHHPSTAPSPAYPDSGTATPTGDGPSTPSRTPTRFIGCVRRPESAKRVRNAVSGFSAAAGNVTVLQNENVKGVEQADVVILGCKPYMVSDILSEPGMRKALEGKLLISILAGVTGQQIEEILAREPQSNPTRVIRAMPNTAAVIRESMTVLATPSPPLAPEQSQLVEWIFTRIGRVVHLPPSNMDVSTALCGSGPAFLALMLEALADGAVAMGLPRAEAQLMAAQTMRGTAGMVQAGEHPALIREKVSTPGGCTIGGLLVLEEGRLRGTISRGVREAAVVASELGKGGVGVNGTRFNGR